MQGEKKREFCAQMFQHPRSMQKAFKYRIYPTSAQREQIERIFGCCRWVWNRAREMRLSAFQVHAKMPGFGVLCAAIPGWKKEFSWLADADSMALQQAVSDLARAWKSFLREPGRVGHPSSGRLFRCDCRLLETTIHPFFA